MKIFVQCLACYNDGRLNGEWFDLDNYVDAEELQKAIDEKVLHNGKGNHEEFAVHDYDSFPDMGEYPDLNEVFEVRELLDTHGDPFSEVLDFMCGRVNDAKRFMEGYNGEYRSEKDFAKELYDDLYGREIPDFIYRYIDWDAVAYDLFISDYHFLNGHVFSQYY